MKSYREVLNNNVFLFRNIINLDEYVLNNIKTYLSKDDWAYYVYRTRKNMLNQFPKLYFVGNVDISTIKNLDSIIINYDGKKYRMKEKKVDIVESEKKDQVNNHYYFNCTGHTKRSNTKTKYKVHKRINKKNKLDQERIKKFKSRNKARLSKIIERENELPELTDHWYDDLYSKNKYYYDDYWRNDSYDDYYDYYSDYWKNDSYDDYYNNNNYYSDNDSDNYSYWSDFY